MYFCETENFAYGEINERSFSNPHTWFGNICDSRNLHLPLASSFALMTMERFPYYWPCVREATIIADVTLL